MHPNIAIGEVLIPSWHTFLFIGFAASVFLALYLRPPDFPLGRKEIAAVSILLLISGLFGARILFVILHWNKSVFRVVDLFSLWGGYAYFGSLLAVVFSLWIYSVLRGVSLMSMLDYGLPFLMLSQAFVRVGCLLGGCCYGKVTSLPIGVIFKPVDKALRHPTQAYEAVILIVIYILARHIYIKRRNSPGYTFFLTVFLYGASRFFVEFLRVDSPALFYNITLAQVACLSLALASLGGFVIILKK